MANAKSYTDHLLEEQQKAQNTPAPAADATPSAAPGYADYLAGLAKATGGGQKQVVSAAPAPAGQGYADWLVTMQKNHTVENTPTNAMSYADYLLYMGSDPAGDYKAKVEDANKTYAGAVHSHGKNKEAMVASGLAGSGYGEYLVSTAYAERARAIENAQSVAKAGMEQGKKSYANYLVGLRTENENAAYTGIVTGLLTGDKAKQYAIDKGVTEDRLDVILGQANAAVQPTVEKNVLAYIQSAGLTGKTATDYATSNGVSAERANELLSSYFEQKAVEGIGNQLLTGDAAKQYAASVGVAADRIEAVVGQTAQAVDQARAQNTDAAFAQLASLMSEEGGNMSFSTAIETMKGGIYKDYINAITDRYRNAQLNEIGLALKEGYVVAGAKGRLEGLLKQDVIGESTYHEELGKIQTKNAEFVKNSVMKGNYSVLAEYAKANGLAVPTTVEQTDAVIDHMVNAGVLSNDVRQERYAKNWINTITKDRGSASDLVSTMEQLQASRTEGQISHEQYVALLADVGERCKDQHGDVTEACLKWWYFDALDNEYRVSYKQGDFEGEDIQIPMPNYFEITGDSTKYFVEGKSVPLGDSVCDLFESVYFGTIGGRPVVKYVYPNGSIKYGDIYACDEWYNDDDNAFLAYMCTPEKKKGG